VRISKQLMKAPDREQLRKAIEEESALFVQRLHSPEAVAALSGFISKQRVFAGKPAPTDTTRSL
jgi:hypothetical protein